MKYTVTNYLHWPHREVTNGKTVTRSSFIETVHNLTSSEVEPLFTLKKAEHEYKGKVYPSAFQIIKYADSEYDAAMRIFGDWKIWKEQKEMKAGAFNQNSAGFSIDEALEEQRLRLETEAIKSLKQLSSEGNVTAAKALKDHYKKPKKKTKPKTNNKKQSKEDKKLLEAVTKLKRVK